GFIWLFTLVAVAFLAPAGVYRLLQTDGWEDSRLLLAAAASAIVHVIYHNALQLGYRHGDFSTVYPVARGVAPMMTVVGAAILLAMQLAPVSQVAPLREISMLFGALAGGMHFGERFGKARFAGIVSIAVGALLVTLRH